MAKNGVSWTDKNAAWIFAAGFVATFIYVWGVIQPPLIYQHQQPVFFIGANFLLKQLSYPGGLVDYLSRFFTQLYPASIVGALLITLVIVGNTLASLKVFREFKLGVVSPFLALLFNALLAILHGSYFYTMSYSLAILLTLAAFLLVLLIARGKFIIRMILVFVLSLILYFVVAAPFLLFVVLSIFYELFIAQQEWLKKAAATIFYLLTAILWPLFVHAYWLLYDSKAVFTYLLPFQFLSAFKLWLQLTYLLLILAPLVGSVLRAIKRKNVQKTLKETRPALEILLFVVFISALFILTGTSFNAKHKFVIKIDKLAQAHKWQDVITTAQENREVLHRLVTLHYNEALYHTGQLLDELFSYPQIEGEKGLCRNSGPIFEFPYAMAALMFTMGNPNSAQTWANEALSIEGASPRILKLLALIHIHKREFNEAKIYLTNVSKTIGGKSWANKYLQVVNDPVRIKTDPILSELETSSVNENFLFRFGQMYAELKFLNEKSTPSKMAFEYLMAYNLLSRNMEGVADLAPHILSMSYTSIPRNVEEALILIGMSGANYNVDLNAFDFSPDMVKNFQDFMAIIAKHKQNVQYSQAELLQSFGDTYWYYHIYHQAQELN